ncbi:MAG: phytanoyl-CoA dioxygenase family protein [Actinomycetota bacterium]
MTTSRTTSLDLDRATIEAFRADGAVPLRGVIDADWLAVVADSIEADIAEPGPFYHGYDNGDGKRFHGNLRIWESHEGFRRYCFESPLPSLARQLMGSERVNLFYDQLFVKEADSASPTRWHNDQPYWPVRGRQVVSFWLAIDAVDLTSGGLEFVAGSHWWDRWFQPETFGKTAHSYSRNADYEPMIDIDAERDQYRILSWALEPGDVLAFSAMTVHGAPANQHPERRRRGYAVRYTGDDATYLEADGMSAPLFVDYLDNGDPIGGVQFPEVTPDVTPRS